MGDPELLRVVGGRRSDHRLHPAELTARDGVGAILREATSPDKSLHKPGVVGIFRTSARPTADVARGPGVQAGPWFCW